MGKEARPATWTGREEAPAGDMSIGRTSELSELAKQLAALQQAHTQLAEEHRALDERSRHGLQRLEAELAQARQKQEAAQLDAEKLLARSRREAEEAQEKLEAVTSRYEEAKQRLLVQEEQLEAFQKEWAKQVEELKQKLAQQEKLGRVQLQKARVQKEELQTEVKHQSVKAKIHYDAKRQQNQELMGKLKGLEQRENENTELKADSITFTGEGSPRARGRQPGTDPSAGTFSRIKDAPRREGGHGLLVVGDSIIRNIERGVCDGCENRTVTCLPGAKVADITSRIDRLVRSAGEEVAVVVHVGTNDVGKCNREALEAKFRLLGRSLKARTPKVAFSEVLPVPRAGPARQAELRGLNAWMRRWCREEGFRFVRHWGTFWDKSGLYKRDGLHLNRNGTRLLALNIKKVAEQLLN